MEEIDWLLPSKNMDFWKIDNDDYKIEINWSNNIFLDYKKLCYQFSECAIETFEEIFSSYRDNIKADMWFITAIFLCRQSIELGLKALLCNCFKKKKEIQNIFEDCKHDLSKLFNEYLPFDKYLTKDEVDWLLKYFDSLEIIDSKSDFFRYPFDDDLRKNFNDKFLENNDVANNLMQAFYLIRKCLESGKNFISFDSSLSTDFFVYSTHGIGNCMFYQKTIDGGFHKNITGYEEVAKFILNNNDIKMEDKFYPIMFMLRHLIELCLKRMLYYKIEYKNTKRSFEKLKRSHLIKKDLWKNLMPTIFYYAEETGENISLLYILDNQIDFISSIDKNGDMFRYPTSYSFEYRFDNKSIDLKNIYEYLFSVVNLLDGCCFILEKVEDYYCSNSIFY